PEARPRGIGHEATLFFYCTYRRRSGVRYPISDILSANAGVSEQADEEGYTSMTNCDVTSNPSVFRDADLAPLSFAAAQTAKSQCMKTCRARYRACVSMKQIPSPECRGVYRD